MEPRVKLSQQQMKALLKRHLDRAEGPGPAPMPEVSTPVIPGMPEQTPEFAPMGTGAATPPPPMTGPIIPAAGPAESPNPPVQGEVATLIDQAEQLYSMVKTGNLGRYWESLFRTSPEAKNYKDPELMFISMFIQRSKDPALFAQSFPDEARLFDNLTGTSAASTETAIPIPGAPSKTDIDPVAIYRKLGGITGASGGSSRTVQR